MNWKLAKIQFPVYNLGPGKRVGIWVQGCNLYCRNCINKDLWDRKKGKNVKIVDISNLILLISKGFEGITITGGEPFEQYEQLISFLHLIKKKTTLSVQCFTGYYLHELYELFPDRLFLNYIDFIVDGRYIESIHENRNIRGSSNQTVYQIRDKVPEIITSNSAATKWSINVDENNMIYMAGIPKKDELEGISKEMLKNGFKLRFH